MDDWRIVRGGAPASLCNSADISGREVSGGVHRGDGLENMPVDAVVCLRHVFPLLFPKHLKSKLGTSFGNASGIVVGNVSGDEVILAH